MVVSRIRAVLDTNVLLRGLLNTKSASGRILEEVEKREVILLLSRPVVGEYRAVLSDPVVVDRFPELKLERVEIALRRFRYFGEYRRSVRARFDFPRDPRDEKLIELAIAAKATDIISLDKDLLSLPGGHGDAAKRLRQRLPGVMVLTPMEFLSTHGMRD